MLCDAISIPYVHFVNETAEDQDLQYLFNPLCSTLLVKVFLLVLSGNLSKWARHFLMFLTIAFRLRLSVVVVGVTSRTSAVDDHSLGLKRIEEYERNMMNLLYTSRYSRSSGLWHGGSYFRLAHVMARSAPGFLWKRF